MNLTTPSAHVTQGRIIVNSVDCLRASDEALLFHVDCASKYAEVLSWGFGFEDDVCTLTIFLDATDRTLRTSQIDRATMIEIELPSIDEDALDQWDVNVDGGRYSFIATAVRRAECQELYSRPDLHDYISELAAEPDGLPEGIEIDVKREIITLRSSPIDLDIDGDGLGDGPVFASLDAENAPFTGVEHCVFALTGSGGKRVSAVVEDDQLEDDPDWSVDVRRAMSEQFALMLTAIGFAHATDKA